LTADRDQAYRRHRQECEAGHPADSKSGEFEEGRRGWKRCACVIHASGTIAGTFNRKQTGEWQWEAARSVAAVWIASGSWDGIRVAKEASQHVAQGLVQPTTIIEAMEAFLAHCKNRNIADAKYRKYKPSAISSRLTAKGETTLISTNSPSATWTASMPDGRTAFARRRRNSTVCGPSPGSV